MSFSKGACALSCIVYRHFGYYTALLRVGSKNTLGQ